MSRLSEVDRHRALGLLQAGLPISEVSLRMNLKKKTIFKVRQRLHETDTLSDRPRSGRPRCTTQRQDRNLVINHIDNRFLSASASSRHTRERNNQRISANTVRRRLSTSGLRARRSYIGPILTQCLRHQRTLWAQEQPRGIASNGEVSYSVTNLDSASTMLMAMYMYAEEAVPSKLRKGTRQVGWSIFDDVLLYWKPKGGIHIISRSLS
ncbi:transposable element Tc1 transposase [Elysia marginata]|uniref:Transposable element Tc1 transposase n=1 Tax=Elysia marginata TaxID=1093978 RepID=A0AAV4J0E6_9GAST|nr:transposable element Tc1 transposase [Elysia marginata]